MYNNDYNHNNNNPHHHNDYSQDKTPTFTPRNKSRKKLYVLVLAGLFIALLVTVILLHKREKNRQIFENSWKKGDPRRGGISGHGGSSEPSEDSSQQDSSREHKPEEAFYPADSIENEVTTIVQSGPLVGQVRKLNNGRSVVSYLGVPYAAAPVGANRFEPPRPVVNWTHPLKAFYQPPQCAQVSLINTKLWNISINFMSELRDSKLFWPFQQGVSNQQIVRPVAMALAHGHPEVTGCIDCTCSILTEVTNKCDH